MIYRSEDSHPEQIEELPPDTVLVLRENNNSLSIVWLAFREFISKEELQHIKTTVSAFYKRDYWPAVEIVLIMALLPIIWIVAALIGTVKTIISLVCCF
jgi:hypothetical protein